jgi:hypothetical protein
MKPIYLDNNATTACDPAVVEAMLPFFTEQFGNASSIHSFGNQVGKALKEARARCRPCLAPRMTRRSSSPPAAPNPIQHRDPLGAQGSQSGKTRSSPPWSSTRRS